MALKLEWSEEALEDIESIATYIEKDSPTYAKSVVSTFFGKTEILKDFTELGRKVPELNDINIREIFVYSYRLIYKINEETVLLVAVVHGKRLLENHEKNITKHSINSDLLIKEKEIKNWEAQNKISINNYNERVAKHGTFSDEIRSF